MLFAVANFTECIHILVSHCVVCKERYDGGHVCTTCKNPCHVICGEAVEAGFGKPVLCFQCKNLNDGHVLLFNTVKIQKPSRFRFRVL